MNSTTPSVPVIATAPAPTAAESDKFIIRGVHLEISEPLRQAALLKASRLLRHHDHILRIRLDLELDQARAATDSFVAKGRIEVRGDDLLASASSENAYKSVDLLVDKLDALLRRRHQKRINTRNDPRRQSPEALHGKP